MEEFALNGFYYQLDLGVHCASGDASCSGTVFVYRVVGAQAYGFCQVHDITVRIPAWLLSEFAGDYQEAGQYVMLQAIGGSGEIHSKIARVTDRIRERLDVSRLTGTLGYMRVEYLNPDRNICLAFRPIGGYEDVVIAGEYLTALRPHVRAHLEDGFGILCAIDFENTGQTWWPEFPIETIEDINAA